MVNYIYHQNVKRSKGEIDMRINVWGRIMDIEYVRAYYSRSGLEFSVCVNDQWAPVPSLEDARMPTREQLEWYDDSKTGWSKPFQLT